MKSLIVILVSTYLLVSCNFNANVVHDNDQIDKENAESITSLLYWHIEKKEFDSVFVLFSDSFYTVTTKNELKKFLIDNKNKLGDFKDYTLSEWKTHRVEGTNSITEYYFVYNVKYSNGETIEKISLVKEKKKIKICSYIVDWKNMHNNK